MTSQEASSKVASISEPSNVKSTFDDTAQVEAAAGHNNAPRFPVRWRWTIFVGLAVMASVSVLSLIVLDLERSAWLKNQEMQAGILVDRLGDELKIPMLAGRSAEVELIMQSFSKKVPDVMAVYFRNAAMRTWSIGNAETLDSALHNLKLPKQTIRLPSTTLWYAKQVTYGGADVAIIAVRYSEDAWESLAGELLQRMVIAAFFVIILAGFFVFWLAKRMSRPLEDLAFAARRVAKGDYSKRLTVSGNDEFSDAANQFNAMIHELQHKEEIRKVFGRYLNPELVSDVFESKGSGNILSRKQEVTVLFADMVGFTAFSESSTTEEVVDVLNQHFEIFHRIIDYYGGHVDKYIGDAVMAVFNHPEKNEQHVRNATMAAIAMTIACKKLGLLRKSGECVSFRVGLNCGDVIVGNIGAAERLEYTVIGDAVNVASRMGGLGDGGKVVMPFATFEAAEQGFAFQDMGDIQVKGVSESLRCGVVSISDDTMRRDLSYAVAQAFDMTLPTDVRMIIGDIA